MIVHSVESNQNKMSSLTSDYKKHQVNNSDIINALMCSCDVSITYDCAHCGNKSEHNMSSHASQPIKTSRTNLD